MSGLFYVWIIPMSQLETECCKLINAGVNPQDVINVARITDCSAVLDKAFPTMPVHVRQNIMLGHTSIEYALDGFELRSL